MKTRQSVPASKLLLWVILILGGAALVYFTSAHAIVNMLTSPSERLRKEGEAFAADGRLPEAVLTYRQAVNADPGNTQAVQALVASYEAQGRMRLAAHYRQLLNPNDTSSSPAVPTGSMPLEWAVSLVDATPVGAAVQNGEVVVAYEDGTVAALLDGKVAWKTNLNQPLTGAPALDAQHAWVGGQNGTLYALSLANGQQIWQYQTGGPIYAAPAIDSSLVYCPSGDGSLYALRASDGSPVWKFTTPGQLHGSPVLADGKLFFGSMDGKLYAVEAATGAPVWQDGILTGGPVESQPAFSGGRVIFGAGDGRVYALAPETGGQYWRFSTSDAVYARPVALDGIVYIASSGKTLTALDFLTGKKYWQTEFNTMLSNPPAARAEKLYLVADSDPNLYILEQKTGKIIQQFSTGDWTSAGPWWIDGNHLLLLGKDGMVLAYRLPD